MDPFTIIHSDDFERTGKWSLARRSLGLESFGMNLVEIPPGEDIPEHDETGRDQEEVFIVLDGTPSLVIDGEKHATRPGTFARLAVECRRTMVNDGDVPARVLIISAPRTSGYEPMGWA
jgi:(S)-ureidoglycine aminohydrolase